MDSPNTQSHSYEHTLVDANDIDIKQLHEQARTVSKLEGDITDVNQLFNKLGEVLHEQGEKIDSIEANFEQTDNYVSDGARTLRQASAYRSRLLRRRVYCAALGASLLVLLFCYIYWGISS